jgi:hypothetical protein
LLKNNLNLSSDQIDYLLSPKAIRERAAKIYQLTESKQGHFILNLKELSKTTDYVLQVIRKKYPDLNIPFHSRWGHFKVGGVDRVKQFDGLLANKDKIEKARCKLDLVITSVLLDAGAGPEWSYLEKATGQTFSRSEGLGVASYHMFYSSVMSWDQKSLRADSIGLQSITENHIKTYFQVTEKNPLVGIAGRKDLLNNLGKAVENKKIFKDGRPGNIIDYLVATHGYTIPAVAILRAVLDGFGSIWPGRLSANNINLGDVWIHPKLGEPGSYQSLVPIHKLSQWMTYSLIEPIEEAGFKVQGVEELTGLAEYRNGGLLIDSGLLNFKNSADAEKSWTPDSELILEWRALTVYFLDQIGERVQKALGKTPQQFPLAKVLEGGTWWAGRFLAAEKRKGGSPPLNIKSDGTVF